MDIQKVNDIRPLMADENQDLLYCSSTDLDGPPEFGFVIGTGRKWYKPFVVINIWLTRITFGWLY